MNTKKFAVAALLLLGVAAFSSAESNVDNLIESIDAFLDSESETLARPARQLQQAIPTYPPEDTLSVDLEIFLAPPSAADTPAFLSDVAAEVCAAVRTAPLGGSVPTCTAAITGAAGRKLLQATSIKVTVTIKFTPPVTKVTIDIVRSIIVARASTGSLFSAAFLAKWGKPVAPSPPPAVNVVPCPSCAKTSPPPPPVVTVIACPPPPVSTCVSCGGKTASPPPPVATPCTTCKTPSPVATPSPCRHCGKTPSPVATPSPCPSPVAVPSPCRHCGKTPSPVATPSPCASPVAVPSPVATPSPVSKPPAVPCGTKTKWVKKYTKHGKKYWSKKRVTAYCSAGKVCCDVPNSWGKKFSGPKHKKGSKSQKKCYWGKCPKSCWY